MRQITKTVVAILAAVVLSLATSGEAKAQMRFEIHGMRHVGFGGIHMPIRPMMGLGRPAPLMLRPAPIRPMFATPHLGPVRIFRR